MHSADHGVAHLTVYWVAASVACLTCLPPVNGGIKSRTSCSGEVVLGACVPVAVADAYCEAGQTHSAGQGAFAHMGPEGCVFRECPSGEHLDIVTGSCDSARGSCDEGRTKVLSHGLVVCLPNESLCPRGTIDAYAADGARTDGGQTQICSRPVKCPLGSIATPHGCVRLVTAQSDEPLHPRIDIATWSAEAFGPHGGQGSPDLCRPLYWATSRRAQDGHLSVRFRVAIVVPNNDISQVRSSVTGTLAGDGGPAPPGIVDAASRSVASLVETLRAWGGDASTAAIASEVTCTLQSVNEASLAPPAPSR